MAYGRSRRVLIPVACAMGVAACTLDFDRFAPGGSAPGGADGGLDGQADAGGGPDTSAGDAPGGDVAVVDAPAGKDVAQEAPAPACTPTPSGTLVAQVAPGAITVDGDLGDWGSPSYQLLAASNAALIVGPNTTCTAANATQKCLVPAGESAETALAHDAANLYVGVRVSVAPVGGTNTTDPYLNDAVEVYLRGDPTATGNYTNVDHQYVVDWQNLLLDYGPSPTDTPQPNPPGVTTAVKVGGGGYVVEMKIALSQLGQTALAPGQTLGFDLALDHGNGNPTMHSQLVWWLAQHAAPTCTNAKCTGCTTDQPYCDTLDFGAVCAQ